MALNGLSEKAQKNFDKYLGEGVFEEMLRLCHDFNEDITLSASENALFTEMVIQDTGKGFEDTDIPHIFERFYKGKNSGPESVGIGLALCRTIITGLDGTIKAENVPGGGAGFVIRFYKNVV